MSTSQQRWLSRSIQRSPAVKATITLLERLHVFYYFTRSMASTEQRQSEEAMYQPQNRTESDSDHSSEGQLLKKSKVVRVSEQQPLTTRSVRPVLSPSKAIDAGVFLDVSTGPVRPTCWTSEPTLATCPACNSTARTVTEARFSTSSLFFGGAICMTCGLCLLSLLCPCCKDTGHFCGKCGNALGRKSAV